MLKKKNFTKMFHYLREKCLINLENYHTQSVLFLSLFKVTGLLTKPLISKTYILQESEKNTFTQHKIFCINNLMNINGQ